ncbi:hypothetical protein BJ138DRAFT_1100084 [Hygrophoropsis aurantiaca]|uniref:Uncharacterized protein n=1 Tax=Hygrophoropsis aurantiaca TaxID=72124 RepID=A0ACB8AGI1_9AGAM|nr:hypothetical protein BJ138DRAFT_1100084 [Hygrophoropsis aurantiaca]
MASTPEYWTRIVFIIDAPSPISVQSCFQWSQNLPLDVYVTCYGAHMPNHSWTEQDRQRERAQVAQVMDSLRPNVPRCTSIRFDVVHASSLPLICEDFHGEAPDLRELELTCLFDDETNSARYELDATRTWDFFCPKLSKLALNGANFATSPQLFDSVQTLVLLNLSHYKASHCSPWRLRPHDVCSALARMPFRVQRVHSLIIQDVEFDAGVQLASDVSLEFDAELIAFHRIKSNDIFQILDCTGIWTEGIIFEQCPIANLSAPIPGNFLQFLNIAIDQDLSVPLTGWLGDTLYIFASPCFNDDLLRDLADDGRTLTQADGEGAARFICDELKQLHISNCTNFSVESLKEMIKSRKEVAYHYNPWEDNDDMYLTDFDVVPPIHVLRVGGGPPLGAEDREWFWQNVPEFSWTS